MDLHTASLNVKNECVEMNEDGDRDTQGPVQSETQQIKTVFDSNQNLKANVWKELVSVGKGEDGKERGRCIHCSIKLVIERTHGTSHLRRHLQSCPMKTNNASGGDDGQDRPICDHNNPVDKMGTSVSESSRDIGVSNIILKKRQRSSISEGKTCLPMLDLHSATLSVKNECVDMNEECDRESQEPVRSEIQAIKTVFDSNQKLKADCWKEFVSVGIGEDGKERGRCIHCSTKFVIKRNNGTSHLNRHLLRCPMKTKNASGGDDGQDRPICDHNNPVDKMGASVSESSRGIGVSNIILKKRQRSSISEGKTCLPMLDLHSATLSVKNECVDMNEECDRESQEPVRSEIQAIKTVFDSNQKLKADCWKEFVPVGIGEDGKERGRCIHCSTKFVIKRNNGTSHLNRHLLRCPMKTKNASEGSDTQNRQIYDHKHKSVDVMGASVSESSCEREDVSNILLKKRKHSSISECKTRSGMLLGMDILDCPICFEALTIPIFQCANGHLACSSCCPKLSNKCPTCDSPIGHNRSRAMESVLESVFVPCRNAKLGCTKNISYGKESTHEKECSFSQCTCPALNCKYTGSYKNIYNHFVDYHCHDSKSISFVCGGSIDVQMNIVSNKIFVLGEPKKRLLFTLQCFSEPHGVYVTVRCIAPSSPEVKKLAYCINYSMDGHTLTYKSPEVKRVLQLGSQTPQDNFMFVPHSLLCGELLEMKISIGLKVRAGS